MFGVLLTPLLAAGCASGPSQSRIGDDPARDWGDRTVAMTYKDKDPTIAYFAPSAGEGGRMFVWDGGEDAIEQGDWRIDERGNVCMSLAIYRKQSSGQPGPLKATSPFCTPLKGPIAGRFDYRGDVFDLNGKTDPPYILSNADNERIVTVLASALRDAR